MDNNFIRAEIAEGFQKLKTLGLENSPSADIIRATVEVWVDAIERHGQWNEALDKGRITQAFNRLINQCDKWPTPSKLIECIPPRAPKKALPKPKLSPAERAKNVARLHNLMNHLTKKMEMPK